MIFFGVWVPLQLRKLSKLVLATVTVLLTFGLFVPFAGGPLGVRSALAADRDDAYYERLAKNCEWALTRFRSRTDQHRLMLALAGVHFQLDLIVNLSAPNETKVNEHLQALAISILEADYYAHKVSQYLQSDPRRNSIADIEELYEVLNLSSEISAFIKSIYKIRSYEGFTEFQANAQKYRDKIARNPRLIPQVQREVAAAAISYQANTSFIKLVALLRQLDDQNNLNEIRDNLLELVFEIEEQADESENIESALYFYSLADRVTYIDHLLPILFADGDEQSQKAAMAAIKAVAMARRDDVVSWAELRTVFSHVYAEKTKSLGLGEAARLASNKEFYFISLIDLDASYQVAPTVASSVLHWFKLNTRLRIVYDDTLLHPVLVLQTNDDMLYPKVRILSTGMDIVLDGRSGRIQNIQISEFQNDSGETQKRLLMTIRTMLGSEIIGFADILRVQSARDWRASTSQQRPSGRRSSN
jgi:hypothetical protein